MAYETEFVKYEDIRSQVGMCDLIEFAGNAWFPSRAIRMFTQKPVNHSSIVIQNRMVGDWNIRNYIYEADENGYHPSWLSNRVKKFNGKIYWHKLNPVFDKYRAEIGKSITDLEGVEYDWWGCVGNAFGRSSLDPKKLYCSEAIQYGFLKFIGSDAMPSKEYLNNCIGIHQKILNGNYGLRPGELHTTGIWGKPIRIK